METEFEVINLKANELPDHAIIETDGYVNVFGDITGNVKINARGVCVNGSIGGDVEIKAEQDVSVIGNVYHNAKIKAGSDISAHEIYHDAEMTAGGNIKVSNALSGSKLTATGNITIHTVVGDVELSAGKKLSVEYKDDENNISEYY